ncbi:MAG: ATP-binding protein [bacterium]|nr:ATP-binding protein [bacterium]
MQFRTKARAVDLLGKGQIADLPTAISELWKNGYDAYASNLGAVLYTEGYEDVETPFFVLSDDGKGMSSGDLQKKWLVLGTDSKSRGELPTEGEETLWKKPRPIMGEKGIGRLSVAYLGSPMLMLTKKIGHPLQALYFDWRTLENYNLFLDDVNIPIESIPSLNDFDSVFKNLRKEFLSNFLDDDEEEAAKKQKPWSDQQVLMDQIIQDTNSINIPEFFEDEVIADLIGDSNNIHGTKFIVFQPDEQFHLLKKWNNQKNNADDVDINSVDEIRTGLVGFYNEFKFDPDQYEINTSFILKDKTGERDINESSAFFNSDDFENCDHLIEGEFDEFGTFEGKIRVYNETIKGYTYRSNRPGNRKTSYGKFKLKLGYVPGKLETSLEDSVFNYYNYKLKASGGLYIYRDDLRVLPYGRPSADFLEFEEKRSKGVGYYFFSYRRMFGYIELTRNENQNLRDKAGREGFINNAAFREFRVDLQGLFGDLAREYFGTKAKQDLKQRQLKDLKDAKATAAEEKKKESAERKQFKENLKNTPYQLASIGERFDNLYDQLKQKVSQTHIIYLDIKELLRQVDILISEMESLEPQKPKRFKMNSREQEAFYKVIDIYETKSKDFSTIHDLRNTAIKKLEEEELINEYENKFQNYISLIDAITAKSKEDFKSGFKHVDKEFEKTESDYKRMLQEIYNKLKPSQPTKPALQKSLEELELEFSDLRLRYQKLLDAKSDHILRLNFDIDDDALVGLYKNQYEEALKELDDFRSMAQLGIAVEIINHELNSMYSQLSTSISEIGKYLNDTKEAQKHFKYLKNSFEHLDSKYQSLNPLYRKSKRTKRYIKGNEILDYLNNFFEETFNNEGVSIEITESFRNSETYTFESILLPALVNVINNALYWIRSSEEPKIRLDYEIDTKSIIICNNGPGIRESSLEEIFELFYTRRPKGRGIGLYLSKDGLNTAGYDILATNEPKYNQLNGASFIIKPIN